MIVDGFIFFNELDILKIRLEELYPVVDRFVLVESDQTFRGNTKPYIFEENKKRFQPYLDKVMHIMLTDSNMYSSDPTRSPWEREKWQRNQISLGLQDLGDNDIVIISDVDEIPKREIIPSISPQISVTLSMRMYYYGLNIYDENGWGGAKAVRNKYLKDAESLRHSSPLETISDAGWHFSYLGDMNHIKNKIQSFAHWELDTPDIVNLEKMALRMANAEDIWGHGNKYQRVEVDSSYPHEILDNLSYYSKYIR